MINNKNIIIALLTTILSFTFTTANALENSNRAKDIIEDISEKIVLISKIENKDNGIEKFIETEILRLFDIEKISRYIIGRSWLVLSEEQKDIVEQYVIKNIRNMIYKVISNSEIKSINVKDEVKVSTTRELYTVDSDFEFEDGDVVEVTYRVFKNKKGQWLSYDIIIENISTLIVNKRTMSSLIDQNGIEKTIELLK